MERTETNINSRRISDGLRLSDRAGDTSIAAVRPVRFHLESNLRFISAVCKRGNRTSVERLRDWQSMPASSCSQILHHQRLHL